MSNIYKGEFQDYEGNVVYPHTSADVVFATDGQTIQKKLNDAEIDYTDVKAQLTSGEHEFRFGITADGEYGYHKEVEGADTVIPFKNIKNCEARYSIVLGRGSNVYPSIFPTENCYKKVRISQTGWEGYRGGLGVYGYKRSSSNAESIAIEACTEDGWGTGCSKVFNIEGYDIIEIILDGNDGKIYLDVEFFKEF